MKYYAVRKGFQTGIFTSWEKCKASISGFSDAEYKSFTKESEAEDYLYGEGEPEVSSKSVYAVKEGNAVGKFYTWNECKSAIEGFPRPVFKKFRTDEEADAFLEERDYIWDTYIAPYTRPDTAVAFVDGSFFENGEYGSGVLLVNPLKGTKTALQYRGNAERYRVHRNVSGEIFAVLSAVSYCKKNQIKNLTINYDYIGIEKWATGEWKSQSELTDYYASYCRNNAKAVNLTFVKVKGHSNNKYNDIADELAKGAIRNEIPLNTVVETEWRDTDG